ncbi:MAG: FliH/SctL family protein [Planctomycetota bacterium]
MPLLKADNVPTTARVFQMEDVQKQASAIVDAAKQKAATILARADAEAAAMRDEAQEAGYATGLEQGTEDGQVRGHEEGKAEALASHQAQLQQLITTLSAALESVDTHRQALADEAAADVARLAVAVAEKITRRQGSVDPEVLARNITAAARCATGAHDVRLAVAPGQAQLLSGTAFDLELRWPDLKHAKIVEDDTIAPGGCKITAVGCEVDATLDTQLERLAAELLPE